MKAAADTVVTFHYALSDESGQPIESSRGGEPLTVLLGHGGLVEGIEQALVGRSAGEQFSVVVPPEQGYGARRPDLTQRISKKHFQDAERLMPGMQTVLRDAHGGGRIVTVLKVGSSVIDVDLNHPMAGRTLNFELELSDVRAATPDEIEHKHAHGPGGHHEH